MPMIVTQQRIPITADPAAMGSPVAISQMIFSRREPAPPPYCTSFPKGKKLRDANLKH